MKTTRPDNLEERAAPARWARDAVLELERALEVATLRVERYEVTGDPVVLIEALEHLESELRRAAANVAVVKNLYRPEAGGDLSTAVVPDGAPMPHAAGTGPQAQTFRGVDRSVDGGRRIEALAEHATKTVVHLENALEQTKRLTGAFVRLGIRDPLIFAMEQLERHALESAGRAVDLKCILESTDTADWKKPGTPGGENAGRATEGQATDAHAASSHAVGGADDPEADLGS